jgi:predicted MFS family arabinose efflux permease
MVPQVLASAQALYAPRERAAVFGVVGAVAGLAAAAPLLGGWLVSANAFDIGWRSIFVINVPVGIALAISALLLVPNTRSEHPLSMDWTGFAFATTGLVLLVYPLVEGRQLGWPRWIWMMLIAAPVVLTIFVRNQRRRMCRDGSPLVPMSLFANLGFASGSLVQCCFQVSLAGFFLILTLYVQLGLGFSAIGAGLVLLPFSSGALAGSCVSAPLTGKLGKPCMTAGATLMAAAVLWARHIIGLRESALSGWDLLLPMAATGVGVGLFVVPLVNLAVATVNVRDAGAASGVFTTFQQVGAALGIAIVGTVFFGEIETDFTAATIRGAFLTASSICVAGLALAAVSATVLPHRTAAPIVPGDDHMPEPV